jgi:hypothetical protein
MKISNIYESEEKFLNNAISYPGLPPRKGLTLLRIWLYPSFSAKVSWSLIKEGKQFFVRRITYDRSLELVGSSSTYGCESELETPSVEEMLAVLKRLSIPVFIQNNSIGLDGETRGIECGAFMLSAAVSWWCKAPEEWKELEVWFNSAVTFFDGNLPQYSAE